MTPHTHHLGPQAQHRLANMQRSAVLVGLAGLAFCVLGFLVDRQNFALSYLTAYTFWIGISAGSLAMIFVHTLTGGAWGMPVRRILEASSLLLIPGALFFAPIVLSLSDLYLWAQPDVVSHDPVIAGKQLYLNPTFFTGRTILYFVIWGCFCLALKGWLARTERDPLSTPLPQTQLLGGLGLVLYAITMTLASVDWGMSLEPHWFSTIYGLLFIIGQVISAFTFAIIVAIRLSDESPLNRTLTTDRRHDLGTLLFVMIMLWAYFTVSEVIIMWSGNLQEEAPWYLTRIHGGWRTLAVALVVFQFAVPFFLLLVRAVKRHARALLLISSVIFAMRILNTFWVLKPALKPTLHLHWLDAAAWAALGGLWLAGFCAMLRRTSVGLRHDPLLTQDH